ncbi:MAG: flagellar protein export ATPase FliI [Granulosicoccaceae bacterium]
MVTDRKSAQQALLDKLRDSTENLAPLAPMAVQGRLTRMVGLTLEAVGCRAAVGERCRVFSPGVAPFDAEVVGFEGEKIYLMPTEQVHGVMPNARVLPLSEDETFSVGPDMLGRVVDGAGRPLDGGGPIRGGSSVSLHGESLNPLSRQPITEMLDVGVRSINSLLTVGRGQRLGLFAGSGVGKSSLLGMMAKYTAADVVVVGLIGERGREVKEFIEDILGEEGRRRSVVIAAPADATPLMRLHGAMLTHSVAEHFRDQGKSVLLLMDSLTRYAQAQREIALAAGEMPATRGYPPSVFNKLPSLVERAGNGGPNGGSITAFYTVLVEGDDQNDPIADAARAILDGHVVLTRELADAGHYPAIDPEASVSRAMHNLVDANHQQSALVFKQAWSLYQRNKDLVSVGAYQSGSDPAIDRAIRLQPLQTSFLQQSMGENISLQDSVAQLAQVANQFNQTPAQDTAQA